ncbi:MAG: hypothetical protein NC405_08850 [Odoribacter sp.]|nr:hypothetical protein [Odoribacter sp.]
METNYRTYRTFLITLIILTTAGAIGWLVNTEKYCDDLCYSLEVLPTNAEGNGFWQCTGGEVTSWRQVWPSMVTHFKEVNGRIPNLLMTPLQLIPRTVAMAAMGLLIGVMFMLALRCGTIDRRKLSFRWMAVGTLFLWLAFPWFDNFQSLAYQMNYVLPAVLFLILILLTRKVDDMSNLAYTLMLLFTLFVGLMHEAFTATLMAYMAVDGWFRRGRQRYRRWILIAPLFLAILIFMGSGSADRLEDSYDYSSLKYVLTRILTQLWPLWVPLILGISYRLKRGNAAFKALWPHLAPYAAGALGSMAVGFILIIFCGRAMWPMDLCTMILSLILTSELIGLGHPGRLSKAAAVVAIVAYIVWFLSVIHWQRKIAAEQRECQQALISAANEGKNVVYCDMSFEDIPFWVNGMASNNQSVGVFFIVGSSYFYHMEGNYFIVVPQSLKDTPYDQWPATPGTAQARMSPSGIPVCELPDNLESLPVGYFGGGEQFFTLHFGDFTPLATPFNRLFRAAKNALGYNTDSITLKGEGFKVNIEGKNRMMVVFEPLPRWAEHRIITRIDR